MQNETEQEIRERERIAFLTMIAGFFTEQIIKACEAQSIES